MEVCRKSLFERKEDVQVVVLTARPSAVQKLRFFANSVDLTVFVSIHFNSRKDTWGTF